MAIRDEENRQLEREKEDRRDAREALRVEESQRSMKEFAMGLNKSMGLLADNSKDENRGGKRELAGTSHGYDLPKVPKLAGDGTSSKFDKMQRFRTFKDELKSYVVRRAPDTGKKINKVVWEEFDEYCQRYNQLRRKGAQRSDEEILETATMMPNHEGMLVKLRRKEVVDYNMLSIEADVLFVANVRKKAKVHQHEMDRDYVSLIDLLCIAGRDYVPRNIGERLEIQTQFLTASMSSKISIANSSQWFSTWWSKFTDLRDIEIFTDKDSYHETWKCMQWCQDELTKACFTDKAARFVDAELEKFHGNNPLGMESISYQQVRKFFLRLQATCDTAVYRFDVVKQEAHLNEKLKDVGPKDDAAAEKGGKKKKTSGGGGGSGGTGGDAGGAEQKGDQKQGKGAKDNAEKGGKKEEKQETPQSEANANEKKDKGKGKKEKGDGKGEKKDDFKTYPGKALYEACGKKPDPKVASADDQKRWHTNALKVWAEEGLTTPACHNHFVMGTCVCQEVFSHKPEAWKPHAKFMSQFKCMNGNKCKYKDGITVDGKKLKACPFNHDH